MKSLYLSLFATLPVVNTMETILFSTRRRSVVSYRVAAAGKDRSGKIISDRAESAEPFRVADRADEAGHHRYYGQAAFP